MTDKGESIGDDEEESTRVNGEESTKKPTAWMMRTYKLYVKNPTRPEACIVMRYITEEAIMYCMEYMPDGRKGSHKRGRDLFIDDDDECSSEYPLDKKGTNHFLNPVKYEQPRRWVLESYDDIDEWKEKRKIYIEGCTSGGQRRRENITSEKPLQFIPWLWRQLENETLENEKVSVLKRLAEGPDHNAIYYKAYRANVFVFHTKGSESSTTAQNSGVTMKAITTFISRKSDPNGVEDETTYYGTVKEILELNYFDFQQTVFYCDWVRIEDKVNDAYEDPLVFKGTTHEGSFDLALAGEVMDEEEESSEGGMAQIEGKKVISFDENAQPIGDNGAKFVSNIGGLIRIHCPIFNEFWRFVPDHHKETIWKNVTDEYDVPTYMKWKVLVRAQRLWCDRNSKYRKFNYDPYPNDEVRKTKCSKRVRPKDWERFLELQREPRVIARRESGKAMRKAMKKPHTSGRRGSGRATERFRKKNPKVQIFRTNLYLATDTRVDGSCLTPELDVELEKIRNICIAEPETFSLDINNDPIAQEKTARFTLEEDLVHVKDKLTTMDKKLSSLAAGRQATKSPSSMRPSSPIALLGKERPCELLSFTGKIIASGRAIGDSHSVVYNIIIDDVTYNPYIDSVDSDPSLSSLNDVELGTTIVWAKMLTRFFN
ncbi:hypothetical protein GIB67_040654 [Kingdonia uniflora]|uniref:Uncharacterized protein n=1 Tax=Kingdonia uniflora TaxID=39325 RepID=A0A7J7KU31_9MAGN|nr:hypothetical protein GIB67_040654 [Kingdonia uniflora]